MSRKAKNGMECCNIYVVCLIALDNSLSGGWWFYGKLSSLAIKVSGQKPLCNHGCRSLSITVLKLQTVIPSIIVSLIRTGRQAK